MSHLKLTRTVITTLMGVAVLAGATSAFAASFLDLTSITPGSSGSFTGTLGPVAVTGAITTPAAGGIYVFNAVAGPTPYESSTIDNSSPQYSYPDIYTPSTPATDRVGYTSFPGIGVATITITFSSPVTNPVFHIANLDRAQYDFTPTAGLGGLVLLSGNGGVDGDGLQVVGNVISDINPVTGVGQNPATHPLTTGARSAYGSVQIAGTFTSLTILVTNPNGIGDGGSFTLSAISDSFQIKYVANLAVGDSVINISNTGALNAGLPSGTTAATIGAICANVYAFTPDEQLVSCCSCPVTPNGLVSLSAKNDLASNTLTPAVPTALVIKLLATLPVAGSCNNSAASVTTGSLVPGMIAFGTTIHAAPGGPTFSVTETPFSTSTLSAGELSRVGNLCNFILANGSGFGVCRSCRLGGLGGVRQ